ncbi:hypothetical protein SAMN05216474_0133 [Lishizhenia tianjinensis]|uniref:Uncharacterized protein n=1 Tax=Lishizhenia tianjinensis TaxID=477690 RepID=A0A1I6XEP6_9FLAO|nr:hypothetical protein [Lishizhenia tianjinensis]SFT36573.1 hypothetical protein SAMN05216474_0133 [Lishizhenia tianjinensis]
MQSPKDNQQIYTKRRINLFLMIGIFILFYVFLVNAHNGDEGESIIAAGALVAMSIFTFSLIYFNKP